MTSAILLPRQTVDDVNTPSGVLAAGDEVGNITIPTTGLYLVEWSVIRTNASTAKGIDCHIRRELPTPAASFHRQLLGADSGVGYLALRMLLRGQVPDSLGGFSEQWAVRATLTAALALGETLAVNLSLTLLAAVLGTSASQERINTMELEQVHALKVL